VCPGRREIEPLTVSLAGADEDFRTFPSSARGTIRRADGAAIGSIETSKGQIVVNKRAGAAAAAAVALLVVAAPAGAATSYRSHQKPDPRIAQLTKANSQLQKQLRNMTTLRDEAKTALATANGQIGSLQARNTALQAQVASLEAQVASVTKARDAALTQVAALQAQIAAGTRSPLTVAVEQVRREVAYAEKYAGGVPYSHGRLVAQAAMDYVVEHVSPTAYGYLEIFGGQLPGPTPDAVLGAQAGLCGDAALAFAAIVKQLGLGARSVQFYYDDPGNVPDSHIAVEVSYDGGWHYYDPTFGVFYTDATGNVLPITDVRAGSGTEQKDELTFTNLVENTFYGDDTWFVTDPTTVVEIDKQPFTG
jgi:transglutaminase-like putative cysteine protease